jgi:hypothetical protein
MDKCFLAFTLILTFAFSAVAQAKCLDSSRIKNELSSKFEFVNERGQPVKPDLCSQNSTAFQTFSTLLFIKDIPAHELEKSDFNPGLIGSSPFEFFAARVKKIVVIEDSRSEQCEDGRVAFVLPTSRSDKKIFICPSPGGVDQIVFSSALIHEARHLDGDEFAHRPCFSGTNKGALSCDDRYSDGGAYGIGLEFLVRLSKNPKIDSELRRRARQLAVVDFLQRFNELPLDIQSGALVRTRDAGELFFYDGQKSLPLNFKVSKPARLALQGGLLYVFDPGAESAQHFVFTGNLTPASGDVLTDRFAQLPAEKRSSLVDAAYGSTHACLVLRESLECFGRDRAAFSKGLEGLRPKSVLISNQTRIIEPGILFLFSEDGNLYRLPPETERLRSESPLQWKTTPSDLRAVQPWTGGEIALGSDGSLSVLEYRSRRWSPATGRPSSALSDLLAPFYWSTRLNEL